MNNDNMRDFTEVTIKDAYGDYTVRVPRVDMQITELMDHVIAPALKASGYTTESVDFALGLSEEPNVKRIGETCCCGKDADSKILGDVLDALGICDAECVLEAIDALKQDCSLNNHAIAALLKEMESVEFKFNVLRHRASELGLNL